MAHDTRMLQLPSKIPSLLKPPWDHKTEHAPISLRKSSQIEKDMRNGGKPRSFRKNSGFQTYSMSESNFNDHLNQSTVETKDQCVVQTNDQSRIKKTQLQNLKDVFQQVSSMKTRKFISSTSSSFLQKGNFRLKKDEARIEKQLDVLENSNDITKSLELEDINLTTQEEDVCPTSFDRKDEATDKISASPQSTIIEKERSLPRKKKMKRKIKTNATKICPQEIENRDAGNQTNNNKINIVCEDALQKLNLDAKNLFPNDPWGDGSPRWVIDSGNLRGYTACWTLETGAKTIGIIASAVGKSGKKIHPDLTLQWIGRQLWGLTIQLPLTRQEITSEHIELAKAIDQEIANVTSETTKNANTEDSARCAVRKLSELKEEDLLLQVEDLEERLRSHTLSTTFSTLDASSPAISPAASPRTSPRVSLSGSSPPSPNPSPRASPPHSPPPSPPSPCSTTSTFRSWSTMSSPVSTTVIEDPFRDCVPEKTSWLKKKSEMNSWQLRWFELKGNRLYYFRSEEDGIPRGTLVIEQVRAATGLGEASCDIIISPDSDQGVHFVRMIKFNSRLAYQSHSRKSYTLKTESEEDAKEWVDVINRAALHCHFKLPLSPEHKAPVHKVEDDNDGMQLQKYGTIRYLRGTDPLLWEINPNDQMAIKKKVTQACCTSDYVMILNKFSHVFRRIPLPRARPITMEQTLKDIAREKIMFNKALYGAGECLDSLYESIETYVKHFTRAHDERVNIVSTILQATARTIGGGDAYFVVSSLLGSSCVFIKSSQVDGKPIEIEMMSDDFSVVTITVTSYFSFHSRKDVDNYDDVDEIAPILRIRADHVQEFHFKKGKGSRYLFIECEHLEERS